MPTITFALKDLSNLVGKKLTTDEISELASYGKGEYEGYDKDTDAVSISFGDTNLPYLWSVEGVARLFLGILGKEKGVPRLVISKEAKHEVIVDKSVAKIRPYIAAFIAKGKKVDDYLIKQLIDLQEKFCESYGRRRKKVAIGVYSYGKIAFPVTYKATNPESVKFVPLDYRIEMTQAEILESHPKGKEYAWILKGHEKYPILMDSKNKVLSFPPVINSNESGKIEIGDEELFFEATGDDIDSVHLAANIFAQAFYDRGFKIISVDVKYPEKKVSTPHLFNETIKINKEQIKKLTGLEITETETKRLLERMRYDYTAGKVGIPPYRRDILHANDVIEDLAISYGYSRIEAEPLVKFTPGKTFEIVKLINKSRELLVGAGYQEVMSAILTNKATLYQNMNCPDLGTIELKEYMSETFSVLRTWIIPVLMELLSKNKHVEYPQKIFEEGLVTVRNGENVQDYHRIAALSAHGSADFTEAKQTFDLIMRLLGHEYKIEPAEHPSFIPGRVGRAIVNGKKVAFIGELSPDVLYNWGIEVPVACFELNLTELSQL